MRRKGLEDLHVYRRAAGFPGFSGFPGWGFLSDAAVVVLVVRGPVPRCVLCSLKQDGQDGQDGQDRAFQECGEKVWKTLMSIDAPQETE